MHHKLGERKSLNLSADCFNNNYSREALKKKRKKGKPRCNNGDLLLSVGSGPSPKRRGPARFYLPPAEHQEETWKDAAAPREGLSSPLLLRAQPIEPRQEVRLNSSNSANLKETSGSGEFPHVFPMCFLCILLLICHADQKRWRDSNYFTQNLTLQAGCSPKA